mgnify:CR=1 FL=1
MYIIARAAEANILKEIEKVFLVLQLCFSIEME